MLTFIRILFLFSLSLLVMPMMGCVVKEKPLMDALACTKKGECASGFRCFDVPGQGALCLSNGNGLEPFSGNTTTEGTSAEEPFSDAGESQPESGSEPEPVLDTEQEGGTDHSETQPESHGGDSGESSTESTPNPESVSSPEEDPQEPSSED